MNLIKMSDIDLSGKRVLIREDLNVPIKDGMITSDQRLQAALPTIKSALDNGAAVIVLSHLGRPEEGKYEKKFSLEPVADYLRKNLEYPVRFVKDYLSGVDVKPGELVVCENVRFNPGEKANDEALAKKLANLCDVFVMDAFGTAHRAQASTYGVAQYAPVAVAGPLLIRELEALNQVLKAPKKPIVAIVGGAKVSSKLSLLKQLVGMVDVLIPGGGIANTFLKAQGFEIGISLYEPDLLDEARHILILAKEKGCQIPLPTDVVVGKTFSETCPAFNKSLSNVAEDDMILDIGPETIRDYVDLIHEANTIIWNGPVGVFEFPQFAYGTRAIAIAIAESDAFSIAGGGDTLAAVDLYDLNQQISYISTGGGAFLECLEGKTLPAVAILQERAKHVKTN
ncbi:TPA: phosphoglycerate kinase [Legionella pneumophila]|uniref:Phosphoglycerate kinase n=3 Tax=Legionella pneumophila TaxID=446 RepID=PGK_LEGPA|nr:phosphoglycerate kinase [Legionella pneumophila]Q5X8U1.1 RecName: Full=Phosphoglycerate kinase [Legionella pneumophila str. Paris]ERH43763.1 phosphoglycerate kinase [Legionella pneumophila str. Leg01/11]ERI47334.1 phosphoglycerate kinase [Legionella pneumophila str. Leg01/20]ANN94321.1 phosphoglycerate kinase [Legionella pneumophila]ERB41717.1 phosphoglycerate kinase [Legionella pneumophila str. 121004]MCW8393383.1 phosphoglycerate kinase [Legionella pneumophila]